jgi:hypothetical protein
MRRDGYRLFCESFCRHGGLSIVYRFIGCLSTLYELSDCSLAPDETIDDYPNGLSTAIKCTG